MSDWLSPARFNALEEQVKKLEKKVQDLEKRVKEQEKVHERKF